MRASLLLALVLPLGLAVADEGASTGEGLVHCSAAVVAARLNCNPGGPATDELRLPARGGPGGTLVVEWTPVGPDAATLQLVAIGADDRARGAVGPSPLRLDLPASAVTGGTVHAYVFACVTTDPLDARCPARPLRLVTGQPFAYAWSG